ncbi:SH3 domain-containing protein, partial [bacterium]|nr:SH3 domain-containing protein [bacterium]
MNSRQRFLILSALVILLLNAVNIATAGDNPFSGRDVKIDKSVYTTPTSKLPPIKEGEKIPGTVEVSTSLNVRSSPWGDILGILKSGDKLTILGQLGDWYKIEYAGKTAFVHSMYVKRPGEGSKPFPESGWVNAPTGLN